MDQPNLSPLHDLHLNNSAKFIEFAGWTMPFSYSGTINEHNSVRDDVGYFDVSHICLLYTSPSPRDATLSRMPSSA